MSLPKYGDYKNSGVDWLGDVPTHWTIGPLKRRFEVCLGKMLQTDSSAETDLLKPYLRAANIQWRGVDITDIKSMWFSPKDIEQLRLKVNDLLVSEGGDVGRSATWEGQLDECYIQNSVNRIRAKADDSTNFLYYWIVTIKGKGYIDVLCNKSTIAHFTAEKVAEVTTPFPPPSEQHTIAAFLDHETAKIDALIAEQEKLIALLAEKRQATISHAVTRGLNPNAPMKDSGVAWLGKVPEHWEVRRVSSISTKITNGYVGPTRDILVDNGVRYLQSLHIKSGQIIFGTPYYVSEKWSLAHQKSILMIGDVLIVQTGDIGQVAVVTEEFSGCNCHALIIVSPIKHLVHGEWLSLVLNSTFGFHSLLSIQTGALHPHLNCGNVKELYVPVPPMDEQQDITIFLDTETAKLEALRTEAEQAVALLKERRSALIAAAVTGQIDVRGLVESRPN